TMRIAIRLGAGAQRGGVRTRTRLGQAIGCNRLHRCQLRQPMRALLSIGEAVDHPRAHIVDRQERRRRNAAARQLFEDQRRIETREPRAAMLLAYIDAGKAQPRELLQDTAVEPLVFPARRVRTQFFLRKRARGFDNKLLVFREFGGHCSLVCPPYSLPFPQFQRSETGTVRTLRCLGVPPGARGRDMETIMRKTIATAIAAAAMLSLAACGENNAEQSGENLDSAIEEATQGSENLGDGPLEQAGESID